MTQRSPSQNLRSVDTNPEHGVVPLSFLHGIDRVDTQSRLSRAASATALPNLTQPVAQPPDEWTVTALLGGVEGLCDHMGAMTDAMLKSARACAQDAARADPTHDAPASIQ